MNPTDVTITAREYLDLLRADLTLTALEAAGVDNWEGYDQVRAVDQLLDAARIRLADRIAERAHVGQVDKAGDPYIDHPRAVADMVRGCGPKHVMAALLHDVVEDTDVTLADLTDAGFPAEVVAAVDSVTRRRGELYIDMVRRAGADPIGCVVKIADNQHNTSRLDNLDEPIRSGLKRRYRRALDVLLAAADVHAADKARAVLAAGGAMDRNNVKMASTELLAALDDPDYKDQTEPRWVYTVVTPDVARVLLARYIDPPRRPLNRGFVADLAHRIKHPDPERNSYEQVFVGQDGKTCAGQHLLHAVLQAATPAWPVWVVLNWVDPLANGTA